MFFETLFFWFFFGTLTKARNIFVGGGQFRLGKCVLLRRRGSPFLFVLTPDMGA